jgi:hypothetical protein
MVALPQGRAVTATPGNPIALVRPSHSVVRAVAAVVHAAEGRWEQAAALLLIMGSMDVDAAIVTAGGLPSNAITAELCAGAGGPSWPT